MKRRTTVLLEQGVYESLQHRARRHGTSVSDEIRQALERDVAGANPNQGWLDLAAEIQEDLNAHPAPPGGPWPAVDSDEAQEQMARDLYRDAMNREPDW